MGERRFVGGAECTLDDKNRISLPSQFRERLGDKFYLCMAFRRKCLWVLPEEEFDALLKKLEDTILEGDEEGQMWLSFFVYNADYKKLDKQNRFSIPKNLQDFAGITGKVILCPSKRVEIWAEEEWQSRTGSMDFNKTTASVLERYKL